MAHYLFMRWIHRIWKESEEKPSREKWLNYFYLIKCCTDKNFKESKCRKVFMVMKFWDVLRLQDTQLHNYTQLIFYHQAYHQSYHQLQSYHQSYHQSYRSMSKIICFLVKNGGKIWGTFRWHLQTNGWAKLHNSFCTKCPKRLSNSDTTFFVINLYFIQLYE